jgi:hypothetical protein
MDTPDRRQEELRRQQMRSQNSNHHQDSPRYAPVPFGKDRSRTDESFAGSPTIAEFIRHDIINEGESTPVPVLIQDDSSVVDPPNQSEVEGLEEDDLFAPGPDNAAAATLKADVNIVDQTRSNHPEDPLPAQEGRRGQARDRPADQRA